MERIVISDGKLGNTQTHVVEVYDFGSYCEASCSCDWSDRDAVRGGLDEKINAHVNDTLKGNYET